MAVFVLTVCIGALISGCGAARTSGGSDAAATDDRQSPETNAKRISQSPATMMAPPEPPGSTLSYGGETVEAGVGTYCWFADGSGACVDTSGTNAGRDKLVVPSGASMSFVYEGKKLDSLAVSEQGGKDLKARRSGTRARIVADLPAGEHVLDVFATMPEGDVSYGFGLVVKSRETASGKAPAFADGRRGAGG